MFGLGLQELLVVLVIVLVLFGASRLPEIGKGIGQAVRNFKKAASGPEETDVTPIKSAEEKNEEKGEESKRI